LRDAGIDAAEIGHVNAHATSTPTGDIAEAGAILTALGDGAAVAGTKSMTGHMLGAAGAVESIFVILALRDQIVPGTQNLDDLDDDPRVHALDIVRGASRKTTLRAAVNDAFGFGGHNVALVFTAA
jgi:3-oxoacyl-[acyl-carrier-protein] synthase II